MIIPNSIFVNKALYNAYKNKVVENYLAHWNRHLFGSPGGYMTRASGSTLTLDKLNEAVDTLEGIQWLDRGGFLRYEKTII